MIITSSQFLVRHFDRSVGLYAVPWLLGLIRRPYWCASYKANKISLTTLWLLEDIIANSRTMHVGSGFKGYIPLLTDLAVPCDVAVGLMAVMRISALKYCQYQLDTRYPSSFNASIKDSLIASSSNFLVSNISVTQNSG